MDIPSLGITGKGLQNFYQNNFIRKLKEVSTGNNFKNKESLLNHFGHGCRKNAGSFLTDDCIWSGWFCGLWLTSGDNGK